MFRLANKYMLFLLSHGWIDMENKDWCDPLIWSSSPYWRNTVHIIVSMLRHWTFEEYRLKVKAAKKYLAAEQSNKKPIMDDIEDTRKALRNIYDQNGPRSLREICRLKLHSLVPTGKAPAVTDKLHLPTDIKDFLSFAVHPVYA